MDLPELAANHVDIERPSVARLFDYALGGSHNFAVDRELFTQMLATMPDMRQLVQDAHASVHRAVCFCVAAGIDQFLDLGWSGIPARGKVHEIAPDARVVYVDTDPVGVAQSRATLAGNDRALVIEEDVRRPDRVLTHPDVRGLLDFDRPMTVLLGGVLSLIPDEDDPAGVVACLRDAIAPGSYVIITHLASDSRPEEVSKSLYVMQGGGISAITRPRDQVERFFAGFDLVEPGLVWAAQWRPDAPDEVDDAGQSVILIGVGRKP
jgi:hypothetical protein